MEKKFTEGRWELDGDLIYTILGEVICDIDPIGISKKVYTRSTEESIANAKLIAAAPNLLEALINIVNITNDSDGVSGYHLNGNIAKWDEFEEISLAIEIIKKATE